MATPSFVIVPDRYKAGKLYAQIPVDGTGDLSVVRGTNATRTNSVGNIVTEAANVPRIDYTGGGCPALLIEPAATNLVLQSEDYTQAVWAKTLSASVSGNTTVAPDGTLTADTFTAGADGSQLQQVFVGASGTTYTVSFYIKRRTGSGVVNIRAVENVNTPITVTNNWTRVSLSATSTSTSIRVGLMLATSGDEVDIWGAQLETGSVATSYIQTVASTQTRNADAISLSSVSGLIGQTEGTLYAEVDVNNFTNLSRIFAISDGTSNNRIMILFNTSNRIRVIVDQNGGAAQADISSSTLASGNHKIAVGYSNNDIVFYIDGSLVGSDNTASIPACSNIYLGKVETSASTNFLNDRIRAAEIYTSRLLNAELAQLTTL